MPRPTLARIARRAAAATVLFTVVIGVALSCTTKTNFIAPDGPRYARYGTPAVVVTDDAEPTIKVVSYNVRYGEEVDEAIDVLRETAELANADVLLLQEMDVEGVDRIAEALDCSYVYYPATLRRSGRQFGNAVLTRGAIVDDEKVVLPHKNPFNRQQRIAVRTALEFGPLALQAYSVHTETPFLSMRSRGEQIDALLASVPDAGACLVAGDFNTMGDESLSRFDDAFSRAGFARASDGVGSTFAIGPFGYAMDHVFVRGLEVVAAGKVSEADASDHVPIWVELAAPRPSVAPARSAD